MLSWFVGEEVAALGLDGNIYIEEESIETRSEIIPHSVLHENVDINLVR
jgi:hypothetical protein